MELYIGQVIYLTESELLFKIDNIDGETVDSYCSISIDDFDITNLDDFELIYEFIKNDYSINKKKEYVIEEDNILDNICFIHDAKRGQDYTEKYSHLFTDSLNKYKTTSELINYITQQIEKI